MIPTLGVVLPVYNAEDRLREQVQQVLDAVTDLTAHFEVVIVDDASTDHTADVAHELATCFPQVRVVRHAERRGLGAACRTGALAAQGDTIFVQEPDLPFSGTALRRFWLDRGEASATGTALNSSLMQRLFAWAAALRRERSAAAAAPIEHRCDPRMAAHNAAPPLTQHAIPVRRAAATPLAR